MTKIARSNKCIYYRTTICQQFHSFNKNGRKKNTSENHYDEEDAWKMSIINCGSHYPFHPSLGAMLGRCCYIWEYNCFFHSPAPLTKSEHWRHRHCHPPLMDETKKFVERWHTHTPRDCVVGCSRWMCAIRMAEKQMRRVLSFRSNKRKKIRLFSCSKFLHLSCDRERERGGGIVCLCRAAATRW